jgi:DNA phosphorothioation-dependent restriction protein DptH
MNPSFIDHLVSIILKQASKFIASENDDLRVVFSAVPRSMLDEVFSRFESMGPRVKIEQNGQVKSVPVLLVQEGVEDPSHSDSARCSSNHVVKIRTSFASYLALAAINDPPLLSNGTTVDKIGLDKVNHVSFSTWREEHFIQDIFKAVMKRFDRIKDNESLFAWSALGEAFEQASQSEDIDEPWDLLRSLFDSGGEGKDSRDLCHSLGLPFLENGEIPNSSINLDLAGFFQENGFNSGIEQLKSETESQDIKEALDAFKQTVVSMYRTPQEFITRPLGNYAKARRESRTDWWKVLTQQVWLELLNQGDSQETGTLKLSCLNEVFRRNLNSQLPVVQSTPKFQIEIDEILLGEEILVSRASGRKKLEPIGSIIADCNMLQWEDSSIPDEHEQYVRYIFTSDKLAKPVSIKVIALEAYTPLVVLNSLSAQKLSQFKKKKIGRGVSAGTRYDCELVTNGEGTHTVEFYFRTSVTMPKNITGRVIESDDDDTNNQTWSITQSDTLTGYAMAVIEAAEACNIEFEINNDHLDETVKYQVVVNPNEFTAKGATSEFDRLVRNNCARSSSIAKVDVRPNMLTNLESWILDDEESFNPLLIGPGFKEAWHPPTWKAHPRLSTLELTVDPRPKTNELSPPKSFLIARNNVRELLRDLCNEKGCTIEALSLGQLMQDPSVRTLIEEYINEYVNWLKTPDSLASWTDLITVHRAQLNGQYLDAKPIALIMSPMNPVKLAWQCNAQYLLHDALQKGVPSPVAGIIDPSSFPDCLALSCRDVNGQFNPIGFASVKSSSEYWSVLWRTNAISEVEAGNDLGVFGSELGLMLEGMVNGFNKQQVKRSFDEIRQLYPAKSRLKVSLHSDSSSYSSCNEGIDEWCLENLGSEVDEWSPAGGLTIQIIDRRPTDEQPEPAVLASLTERSDTSVRWYTGQNKAMNFSRDLSIVDHLQTMDQEFRKDNVLSPVDPSCLSRLSIKKNASNHRQYLSMSRAGQFVLGNKDNTLQGGLCEALELLESSFVRDIGFDSLGFAPNLQTLNASLDNTRYSAISSSAVDASCFHRPGEDAFLWDFELPRYAPGSGQSSGFYLVAKQSPTMVTAMKTVLSKLLGDKAVSDAQVIVLLGEISRRGIPTLKRLTSGGSASLGEVGMLVASRLLQSDFQLQDNGKGLIPSIVNSTVNLVIPADVFQPRFDELRKALGTDNRERPDLLVMSIGFAIDAGDGLLEPCKLKITPIEVKARSGEMTDKQRAEALLQAKSFSGFLINLQLKIKDAELWGIAYRDLLASWLDYGFRVYGETKAAQSNKSWVDYHQQSIAKLMSGELEVEIEPEGRLITIEDTTRSRVVCSGSGSGDFKNTIVLGYELAASLLTGDQSTTVDLIMKQVGDWGLIVSTETVQKNNTTEHRSSSSAPSDGEKQSLPITSSVESDSSVEIESTSKLKTLESPALIENEGLRLKVGESTDLIGRKDVYFYPGNTALNNINVGVVGDLGTGKTQLLKSMIYQMVKKPEDNRGKAPKVLILDYKRDFSDFSDKECDFIDKAKVKVVSPFKLPLNLFATGGDDSNRAKLDKIGSFRDILRKIFAVNAPVQDRNLKEAIKAAYETTRKNENRDPTIYDVFEHYEQLVDGKPDSVSGIMSDLVDYEIFEDDPNKIVSFDEFFNGVVAIDLKGLTDDKLKKMVIVIFLNLYCDYMLRVEKQPFLGKEPQTRFIDSYLLIDEAHNILPYEFPVLSKLLLQGRAFGVGVILASQFFEHFKTQREDYLKPMQSWFIHQVPGVTAKDLNRIGLPSASDSTVDRISGLEPFHSLCKTLDWNGEFVEETPFYKLD